ncbi:ABC transporter permease [Xylocopilactobacillus apicola]|uniref:Permease n=1 Tax=Xylocopilactobacillus apicola TaxID=2932184 RepID=A0AAU9DKQ3_9LACO|nr:ABC transporter permease [Xylocopilactobacillus apicola]BDR59131.1 permease [Xylocopilactobacillus apicola]
MMLLKKLFKDLQANKGQFIAIFLIIFIGCLVFSGLNATWYGMQKQSNDYYHRTNLADYWLIGSNITSEIKSEVTKIRSVKDAERRFTSRVGDNKDHSATIELNYVESNKISKSILVDGAPFNIKLRGIWLDKDYAKSHHLKVGDYLSVSLGPKIQIKGLIMNPEYVYPLGSNGQLLPDHQKFGFGFLSYQAYFKNQKNLPPFNQLLIKGPHSVKSQISNITNINYLKARENTSSDRMLQDKIKQFRTLSTIFPTLFFIVAILITWTTMSRVLKNQRIQIGILSALGFKKKTLLRHYLFYGVVISLPASVVGYLLGPILLPPIIYRSLSMFSLTEWKASQPNYDLLIVLISIFVTIIAIYFSCQKILAEKLTDCLKSPRTNTIKVRMLSKHLSFAAKWNLADCLNNKTRSITIIIAVASCMALMLTALGLKDSLNDIIDWQYHQIAKYETKIVLQPHQPLPNISGERIEEQIIEIKTKHQSNLENLTVYENSQPRMIQLTDLHRNHFLLSSEGLAVSYRLAEKIHLTKGQQIKWRLISGHRWHQTKISDVYRVPINQGFSTTKSFLAKQEEFFQPTAILSSKTNINKNSVQQTISVDSEKNNIKEMILSMSKLVSLLIIAATFLMTVVLYNLGKLSSSERDREINTLKVLGFKNKTLRKIFKSELQFLTVIGIVIGMPIAFLLLNQILKMMGSTTDMMLVVNFTTIFVAVIGTFITANIVNTFLSRQINKANLVEALKSID